MVKENLRFDTNQLKGTMPEQICNLIESDTAILVNITADCAEPNPSIVCTCCTECY
jgi:hypothetical protein